MLIATIKIIVVTAAIAATWYGVTILFEKTMTKILVDRKQRLHFNPMIVDSRF
jgi:hypothetical protein